MTHGEMWAAFCQTQTAAPDSYEAWAFGDDADTLAELVCKGIKTATASAGALYDREQEPLPKAGEYSVVLDSQGNAKCVICTTRVYVTAFQDVDARHAYLEGEGDRSLDYWRQVHELFFREELQTAGLAFDETMAVVCEEFVLVYPK